MTSCEIPAVTENYSALPEAQTWSVCQASELFFGSQIRLQESATHYVCHVFARMLLGRRKTRGAHTLALGLRYADPSPFYCFQCCSYSSSTSLRQAAQAFAKA